jgi:hypothetical protein
LRADREGSCSTSRKWIMCVRRPERGKAAASDIRELLGHSGAGLGGDSIAADEQVYIPGTVEGSGDGALAQFTEQATFGNNG